MKNVLILGSGRSGTSMAAGVLSQAGYFMGENLQELDRGNPKGYFEDLEVNRINEDLLAQVTLKRPSGIIGDLFFRSCPHYWLRWLARVPLGTCIPCPPDLAKRIEAITANEPFCFKDPRFCYTLPAWRSIENNPIYVCVFRHPGKTVKSLLKEAKRICDIWNLRLSFNISQALQVWELMYRHILEIHYPQGGNWLFLHYNQFLTGIALDKLEEKLEIAVYREFVDCQLNRSNAIMTIPPRILTHYRKLCELAEYTTL